MASNNQHTILLVDDEESIIRSLKRTFRKDGHAIISAYNGMDALTLLSESSDSVSLIISDQRMPKMDGAEFLEKSIELMPDAVRFLLTGYSDMDAAIAAVNKGHIHRYLTKPWNDVQLRYEVVEALNHYELKLENRRLTALTHKHNQQLSELNASLETKVKERTWALKQQNKKLKNLNLKLEKNFDESLRLLCSLMESSNPTLGKYMKKVAGLSVEIADVMGIGEDERSRIETAAMIHDIGLVGLPKNLSEKAEKFMTPKELRQYSQHPTIAAITLASIDRLEGVREIILCHHESINGKGYPNQLKKDQIPLGSQILAVAAAYQSVIDLWPKSEELLTSHATKYLVRKYQDNLEISGNQNLRHDIGVGVVRSGVGNRFDPDVVNAFLDVIEKTHSKKVILKLRYSDLKVGMILEEDLRIDDGRLLVVRGAVLDQATLDSIQGIGDRDMLSDKIMVSES